MRIERIDLDGFQGLSGSFTFPEKGLAVWAAPSGAGKTRLWRAVVAAFYGDESTETGWILVRFSLDDGSSYSLARDLAEPRLEITDPSGADVSEQFGAAPAALGKKLFGLSRGEFAAATRIAAAELRDTVGHPDLLSAIGTGPAARETTSLAGRLDGDGIGPSVAGPEDLDLEIFRSPAEEMGYVTEGVAAPEAALDFVIEAVGSDPLGTAPPAAQPLPDPDETGLAAPERLRRLQLAREAIDRRHQSKKRELVAHSERMHDMQSEAAGLSSLREAEPRDIAALGDLLRRLDDVQETRAALVRRDAEYRETLKTQGISVPELEGWTTTFGALAEEDLRLLESFRQTDAVRRGNQALIRSECRLGESKLAEIGAAQERLARLALAPLVLAAAGLFASIAIGFFPMPISPQLPLGLGFVAAITGGLMLWRGRRHRDDERTNITTDQERKRSQLHHLDQEESEFATRLGVLAERCGATDGAQLLDQFDAWQLRSDERQDLDRLAREAADVQRQWVAAREELGRFAAANSAGDGTDANLLSADEIHRSYTRFFELREILAEAEQASIDLEDDLIALETERAELRQAVEDLVENSEPIAESPTAGESPVGPSDPVPADRPAAPDEAPRGIELDWSPALSARTEAILRRILPDVRDVEINGALSPQIRFHRRTYAFEDLPARLTGASIDQVCLALRLAIVETIGSSGERLPVFLDDPLTRADDARHDRALQFLLEDASVRGQVVLLTAQEVRAKWFLHQHPEHREHFGTIASDGLSDGSASTALSPESSPSS